MTKISFIVVAYNAAQSLDALLGDLLSQTIAPEQLEALLVDSASTDDTAQIMRRFAARAPFEVKLLENPKRWLASGINVALRAATGTQADCEFLGLMIRHHQGAIPMSQAVIELGSEPRVLAVAQSIIETQEAEIDRMASMQERLGCTG